LRAPFGFPIKLQFCREFRNVLYDNVIGGYIFVG
jgi:hypothetical protein